MEQCTLVIKDHVNVKFEGLDPFTRRKINEALKYFVPYARHMPSYKLGRWDGKVGFATVGGATFINLLDKVLPIVIEQGYDIVLDDRRVTRTFDFPEISETMFSHKVWPEGHPMAGEPIELRDYQVEAIKTYVANLGSIQSISTGAGKAQPLWSKIKVPGGWTTMGEIQAGDVISTPDVGTASVISIHPQGVKEYFRITFKDGRSADACGDHLWNVYNVDKKQKMVGGVMTKNGNPWRTITTNEIIEQMSRSARPLRVQLAKPENRADHAFMIHPYLLGCLIGDGGLSHPTSIVLSTADDHILNRCNDLLDEEYRFYHKTNYDYTLRKTDEYKQICAEQPRGLRDKMNRYRLELRRLGLSGTKSASKFIPRDYLDLASVDQKMELVRGLIDTDGYVGKTGYCQLTTVSEQLAEDFSYLIRSLGGIATIKSKIPTFTNGDGNKVPGRRAYIVTIRLENQRDVASLPRKAARLPQDYQYADSLKLQITSIEKVGSTECQCILVDSPDHLYITDDFVVTHNTLLTASLSALCEPHGRTLVIVPSKSLVEQTEEDYVNLGLDVGVFYGDRKEWGHTHTIATWQSLGAFSKKTKAGAAEIPIGEFTKDMVCVMVDEVHAAKADVLKDLLTGPLASIPIRWGLTGTIPKEEFEYMSILASLGPLVGEIKASDLQDQNVLARCNIEILQLVDDHVEYNEYHDEYDYLISNKERLTHIAKTCSSISETGNTLILVDRIEAGEFLAASIPGSVFISGKVKTKDRSKEYKEVQSSENKVIIATYGVAAVGINLPRIFNLVLIEAGKSFVRVIQSIGRGLRKAHDKDEVAIFDICSSMKFSKRHLSKRKAFYKEAGYPAQVKKINYR